MRLLFIAAALFGLYMLLGMFAPVVFAKGFIIPATKVYVSYLTAIMVIVALYSFKKVAVK